MYCWSNRVSSLRYIESEEIWVPPPEVYRNEYLYSTKMIPFFVLVSILFHRNLMCANTITCTHSVCANTAIYAQSVCANTVICAHSVSANTHLVTKKNRL